MLSPVSEKRLLTVHDSLAQLVRFAATHTRLQVITGYRDQAEQEQAYTDGKSKAHWLQSPHNYLLSFAVDIAPLSVDRNGKDFIDWGNAEAFETLAQMIVAKGKAAGVDVLWGGDWNRNGVSRAHGDKGEHLVDLPHLELAHWRETARTA